MTNEEMAKALGDVARMYRVCIDAGAYSDEAKIVRGIMTALKAGADALWREQWRPIEEAIDAYASGVLRECVVVLTQHKDDLYPVAAYLLPSTNTESSMWYRAVEGPEDVFVSGGNEPLYRQPTHYRELPEPPEGL